MDRSSGRRITFTAKGKVEILDFDAGKPQKGNVLVEAIVSAVSPGTELSRLYDTHSVPRPYPQNTGYLTCVRVLELGEDVTGIDLQAIYIANMGHLSHLCVSASSLIRIPEGVSAEDAVYTNLMSVSLRSVRQAEIQLGSSVLIFGLGLIGQFAQLFSRLNGATRVVCLDPSERRRKLALESGVKYVFSPTDPELEKKLGEIVPKGLFDAVFDSTGVASVFSTLPKFVKNFGSLIILGGVHELVKMDFYTHIQKRSLRLIGSGSPDPHNYPFDSEEKNQKTILELLQNGSLNIAPLITDVVPLEKAPEMYRILQEEKDKALGVVFKW